MSKNENITLEEFRKIEQDRLDHFVTYLEDNSHNDPENFPKRMGLSDWVEQLDFHATGEES